mmetsp:Transcript_136340/g.436297  ORF Transcript_136340/g.436297 Transcript_136340/m.436297 type:complete len:291 (-) Transcript_136340:784-1656(-)
MELIHKGHETSPKRLLRRSPLHPLVWLVLRVDVLAAQVGIVVVAQRGGARQLRVGHTGRHRLRGHRPSSSRLELGLHGGELRDGQAAKQRQGPSDQVEDPERFRHELVHDWGAGRHHTVGQETDRHANHAEGAQSLPHAALGSGLRDEVLEGHVACERREVLCHADDRDHPVVRHERQTGAEGSHRSREWDHHLQQPQRADALREEAYEGRGGHDEDQGCEAGEHRHQLLLLQRSCLGEVQLVAEVLGAEVEDDIAREEHADAPQIQHPQAFALECEVHARARGLSYASC